MHDGHTWSLSRRFRVLSVEVLSFTRLASHLRCAGTLADHLRIRVSEMAGDRRWHTSSRFVALKRSLEDLDAFDHSDNPFPITRTTEILRGRAPRAKGRF